MKKILLLTAIAVAGMLVTSCSNDDEQVNTYSQTGVVALKAEVVPMNALYEGDRSASRAITAEYENSINDMHIVAFDSDGNRIYHVYSPMYSENPYTTLLNLGEAHKGKTVTIYAIANVAHADLFTTPENGKNYTRAEFEQLNVRPYQDIVSNIGEGNFVLKSGGGTPLAVVSNSQSPIMVSGPLQVTVANNGLTSATLRFIRQDTKITINIVPQKMKILEYKICNVPKISYLFSKGENVADVEFQDLPSVEVPDADQAKTISKQSFHVFENYSPISSSVLTQIDRHDAKIPTGSHPTYVDIIGTPDGYTGRYRYRVYLGGVDSENVIRYEYFTLLRNYEYYLTVKIAGDGTGDPRVTKLSN
jgi:hypothetical protein